MAPTRKYYLKNNNLTLRSKSNEGHYGMRHTSLWSCTHIPNIIDLQQSFDLEVKGQGPTKVIMVRDTPPYGHAPTYEVEEKEAEEKIRLKQYVSLRSKGRHNYPFDNGPFDIVCQQAVYNLDLA
jgi:hypothetical protein